jgi:hypothetical protein
MRAAALTGLAALCAFGACTDDGANLDPGLDAELRVAGGTLYREVPPAADPGAPTVNGVLSAGNVIFPGQIDKKLGGRVSGTARAIALSLDGDVGYWIIPVGLPDATTAGDLDFDAKLTFARTLAAGTRDLEVRAVDAEGRFSAPSANPYTIKPADLGVPTTLRVQLTWDSEADVDLHLAIPDGTIIWARNLNSYKPPGPGDPPADPDAWKAGGILDFDSNSSCVIDGRREENVYWTQAPPPGKYTVKVDTWSLCAVPSARWHVTVTLGDTVLAQATGVGLDSDTRFGKNEGAGVLALTFDVP